MRIIVKAKPKSSKEYVKRTGERSFTVAVNEAPENGKANQAIVKAVAESFGLPLSAIVLISGKASKLKVFEVDTTPESIEKYFHYPGQIKLL